MAGTIVNIDGTSKVPVSMEGIKSIISLLVDGEKTPEVNVKFDARGNVRSTFGQVIIKGDKKELRVYTGAVEALWEDLFTSKDNVTTAQEAVVFITMSLLVDYTAGNKMDMKVANISTIQLSSAFTTIKKNWASIKEAYQKYPVDEPEVKTTSKGSRSPKKPKELPTDDGLSDVKTMDVEDGFSLKDALKTKEDVVAAAAETPIAVEGNQPMPEEQVEALAEDFQEEESPAEIEAI